MAANFKELLSVSTDKVEKPKPIPVGTYDGIVTGHKFDESKEKKTPYCRVGVRPMSPGPDVDSDAFQSFGGQQALSKKELFVDFYLTEDSLFRFKAFFAEALGMDVSGKTFDELCPQMNGQAVRMEITQQPSQDGSTMYSNVKRLLKA